MAEMQYFEACRLISAGRHISQAAACRTQVAARINLCSAMVVNVTITPGTSSRSTRRGGTADCPDSSADACIAPLLQISRSALVAVRTACWRVVARM